ncbi:MAG: HAD-IC family P-type ATPase, partial [Planctomycetes bacterium]|nr:HAD-IC family P-type ATPase [Planctomycetota bacterium]
HLLAIAAGVERHSTHPLAQAIVAAAETRGLHLASASETREEGGLGIVATIGEQVVLVGRSDLLARHSVDAPDVDETEGAGSSLVHVAVGGAALGTIALRDGLRPGARRALDALRDLGLKLVLLTGDRRSAAEPIAAELGIGKVHAEVFPGGKQDLVRAARQKAPPGELVAMVGDGINDGPALAEADVGIAMGTGTDVAKETGDLVLMHGDLDDLVSAVRLARATFRRVKQNLAWAFIYNVCGIPIAAGLFAGWGVSLRPEFAGLAMALSSVSVVTSSLLLRRQESEIFGVRPAEEDAPSESGRGAGPA